MRPINAGRKPVQEERSVETYDLVIRDGTIVDGTTYPRYRGDIAVKDGKIAAIAPDLSRARTRRTLDAKGLIVAPGAIDLHAHFDAQVHWDPYCSPHSAHGTTSSLITSCGFGYAPVRPDMRERTMAMMESTEQVPLEAQRAALSWDWETFPEWLEHLKRTPKAINMMFFIPLNQMMIYVMGVEDAKSRRATPDEMAQLKALLHEAMDLGAAGFSFSRMLNTSNHTDFDGSPMPADVHPEEDFYELAAELRHRGEGVIQITANVPGTDQSHVVEKVARASGRPVIHLVCGPYDSDPEHHRRVLAWVDRLADEGLQVFTAIVSPGGWMEFTIREFNFWERSPYFQRFVNADDEEKLRLCRDEAFLEGAKAAYDPVILGGSGGLWDRYELVTAHCEAYREFEGLALGEIAHRKGLGIVDLMFDLLAESGLDADLRSFPSGADPEKYREVLSHPRTFPNVSDGGAHIQTVNVIWFSRLFSWAVLEHKLIGLEQMHFKASGLPAAIMGLRDRGAVRPGYAADLMIYDLKRMDFERKYAVIRDLPGGKGFRRAAPPPPGMRWVIVNGEIVIEEGRPAGALPGRLISPGSLERDVELHVTLAAAE
jgi:N-acyl-D-aspartate/D-glutamate deacylase